MSFDPVSFAMGKAAAGGGSGGTDVSDTTTVASDVLAGKYFHTADGTKTAGTIAGQAAQTITPGTTDQTIAAGKYLAGAQTVKGDAKLVAENIKSGVSIFGVSGALALPTLNAPSLSLSGDTLSITNPSANGSFVTGYRVYAGNTLIATVQTATVDLSALLTDAGTYSVTAKAYGTGFNDSAASTAVSYTVSAGYSVTVSGTVANDGVSIYMSVDGGEAEVLDLDSGSVHTTLATGASTVAFTSSCPDPWDLDVTYTMGGVTGSFHDGSGTITLTGDMVITSIIGEIH